MITKWIITLSMTTNYIGQSNQDSRFAGDRPWPNPSWQCDTIRSINGPLTPAALGLTIATGMASEWPFATWTLWAGCRRPPWDGADGLSPAGATGAGPDPFGALRVFAGARCLGHGSAREPACAERRGIGACSFAGAFFRGIDCAANDARATNAMGVRNWSNVRSVWVSVDGFEFLVSGFQQETRNPVM